LVVNPKRKDRETAILDLITSTLNRQHSVLIPCDPSPRLLELLVLLDQHWTFKAGKEWNYPLCLVSRTGKDMETFARSLMEWMGGIVRESNSEEVVAGMNTQKKRKHRQFNQQSEYGALDLK
jgi:cleavage and polyadenylation specificity factor subunit 2